MSFPLTTATSGKHRCTTCNKAYSTNSHLRRHEATHSGRQELTCPLCHAQFSRRDLARRHVQNCSTHGHEVILPTLKRGRKRISCDRCSQRKLSCDAKKPCMRCCSGGTTCTYEQLCLASSSATSHIAVDVHPSHRTPGNAGSSAGGQSGRISIDFLLNFTDPSGYRPSAAIAAEAAELDTVEEAADSWDPQLRLKDHHTVLDHPFGDPGDFSSVFFGFPSLITEREDGEIFSLFRGCLPTDLEETSALEVRISELLRQLSAQQNSMLERDGDAQASFDVQLAELVFTITNVKRFVWEFFHYFHDQFPILHKPTFDSRLVSLPLLLTVILFGSISSNPSDVSIAIRQFFDVAEAYVFDQLISRQMLQRAPDAWNLNDGVELLQAGLLFLLVQNNSIDLTVRRRLRLQRIPSLVAAVRASELFAYKRQHLVTRKDRPEWRLFIADETRLRVAAWTFMTDSTLAIFFNSSPHVAISEMMGDLPCGDDLFRAETAVEFEHTVSPGPPGLPVSTFPQLMSILLFAPLSEPPVQTEMHVTAASMLILVCALQSIVMTSRMNFLAPTTIEVILCALDQWKNLWVVLDQTGEDRVVSHQGFERHAVEYWWLARTLLKMVQSGDQSCRYLQPKPSDSVKDLHDFVLKYKDYVG